jgi:RNA polymerase sigma-70 factor (ECF subfamily)
MKLENIEDPVFGGLLEDPTDSSDLASSLFPDLDLSAAAAQDTEGLTEGSDAEIFKELGIQSSEVASVAPGDLEDQKLVLEFLGGSDAAFVQLYAKYETPLLLYCRRMMFQDKLAEDAFQEMWIKIFQLRTRQVTVINFRALLFRSTRNLCLNMIRLERYRSTTSEPLARVRATEETSSTSEQEEIKVLITRALQKLPFEQREAFVMHEYSGYTYQEIADTMGTTEAAIKVRAFRARLRLRKLIASWLGLAEDDDPTNVI